MASARILVHNAGDRFTVSGLTIERRKLTAAEIVEIVARRTER